MGSIKIFTIIQNHAISYIDGKIICTKVDTSMLKICGKYDNVLTKIISAPGMWLQHITTKEPEDDMIEIAIAALKACDEITDSDGGEVSDEQNNI